VVGVHANPGSSAWARASLTRGESAGQIWEISADYPEARLTLGTDPEGGWLIEGRGVHPVHCEFFWDGSALWVADTKQAGGVFLDGMRVNDWVQVHGPAELRFGQAAMDIETSVPVGQQMRSSPNAARPVTVTDTVNPPIARHSSPLFGGAAGDDNVRDLDAEKTRMQVAPVHGDAARTNIAITNVPERAPAHDLRPRLGGAVSTASTDASPHRGETTRMVPMPFGTPGAQSAPKPPSLGKPTAPPRAEPPAPVVARPPAPPPPNLPPASAPTPSGELAFQHPGGFVDPPPPAAPVEAGAGGVLGKVWDKVKPEEAKTEGKQSLPMRTWILLGVTVLAVAGLLLWEDPEVEVAAAPPTPAAQATPTPDPETDPPPTPTTDEPPVADPPAIATADPPQVPTGAPSSEPDVGSETDGSDGEDGPSLQRRAADAYIAGEYAAALEAYQGLLERSPADLSYGTMVRILERRIAEQP